MSYWRVKVLWQCGGLGDDLLAGTEFHRDGGHCGLLGPRKEADTLDTVVSTMPAK